jgi:glycosyltransferase involved in cell wall biosynthesis
LKPATPKRRKVLILTQYYSPEPNFITADVAEALARDSDVIVVTAHPNYPLGRFYQGTQFMRVKKSTVNGVVVWRIPFFPDHTLSILRRGLSYLSFAAVASIVAPLVAGRPDTVWVYHGSFTTGLSSLFFKVFYRSRVVFTCADLWPASFVAAGVVKSRLVLRVAGAYNRALNNAADLIICATRGTRRQLAEEGIPAQRLAVIPVWIGGSRELASRSARIARDDRSIVYAGNLGPAQKVETIILAAAALRQQQAPVHFNIYGSGVSELQLRELADRIEATNVTFHGRVPVEEALNASAGALAQIVCLQPSPLFRNTIPSKLFSAFAAASPILYGLQGEAEELVANSHGGISFDASDPQTLITAVRRLLSMTSSQREAMCSSLRSYFATHFDPDLLISRYTEILESSQPERAAQRFPELSA